MKARRALSPRQPRFELHRWSPALASRSRCFEILPFDTRWHTANRPLRRRRNYQPAASKKTTPHLSTTNINTYATQAAQAHGTQRFAWQQTMVASTHSRPPSPAYPYSERTHPPAIPACRTSPSKDLLARSSSVPRIEKDSRGTTRASRLPGKGIPICKKKRKFLANVELIFHFSHRPASLSAQCARMNMSLPDPTLVIQTSNHTKQDI